MTTRGNQRGQSVWRALAFGAAIVVAQPGWGESPQIVTIEEHWELRVGEPDAEQSAPQITMVMSPAANLDGPYVLFTLNHRNVPNYQPGGMQVQLWSGDETLDSSEGTADGSLWSNEETIRWVQRLKLVEGTVTFEVVDGSSETWGPFGDDEHLKLAVPAPVEGLQGYRPAVSLTESEVGYAGNRVVTLSLNKLKWVTADGEAHELNAPIDIDTDLDP